MNASTVPISSLNLPQISLDGIRDAKLRVANTAPGADEIPTILKLAYPLIELLVYTLFTECLTIGYQPSPFRDVVWSSYKKPVSLTSHHLALIDQ